MHISVFAALRGAGEPGETAGSLWIGIQRRNPCVRMPAPLTGGVARTVHRCCVPGWKEGTVPGPSGSVTASIFKVKPPFSPWKVSWTLLPVLPETGPIASRITAFGFGWHRRENARSFCPNPSRSFLPSGEAHSIIIPWPSARGPA